MRFDRLLALGLFQPLQRIGLRPHGAHLPILMYHRIADDPESATDPYYRTCTSPRRFAEQMEWLAAAGWRGVTLSEGLAALRTQSGGSKEQGAMSGKPGGIGQAGSNSGALSSPKLVAITFDDGYRDFLTGAFPTLQQRGFSASMYLPTAFIGEERRAFLSRECLTWAEVDGLAAAGIEFGSHTVNHPRLADLPWEKIETELRDSKAVIEDRLSMPVHSFAYPYAFPQEDIQFALRFRTLLDKIGYRNCVTTTIGRAHAGSDPLHLPRLPANSADDRALLLAKLAGAYDWLALPQKFGKTTRRWLGFGPRGAQSAPPFDPRKERPHD